MQPKEMGSPVTEQQRQAAWEAAHRPETTGEELARISSAYPEFAAAIAAHPNAVSQLPAAQPDAAQPCAAQSQAAYSNAAAPAGFSATAPGHTAKLNVFGIVALSILAVHAIWGAFMPIVVTRAALDFGLDSSHLSLLVGAINLVWIVVAGSFALVGALKKDAPRMRWTAISSLVVCALSLLSLIASLFVGLLAPLFY